MDKRLFWGLIGLLGLVFLVTLAVLLVVGLLFFTHPARRGGVSLTAEVQTEVAVRRELEDAAEILRSALEERNLTFRQIAVVGDDAVDVGGLDPAARGAFEEAIRELPLPLQQEEKDYGRRLSLPPEAGRAIEEAAVGQCVEVVKRRLREFGIRRGEVRTLEGGRLQIDVPAVSDLERLKGLLTSGGALKLTVVEAGPAPAVEALVAEWGGEVPGGAEVRCGEGLGGEGRTCYLVQRRSVLTGADVRDARPIADSFGAPAVGVTLTAAGGEVFRQFTRENIGRSLAIVLDGTILTAPVIRDVISTDVVIQGGFTEMEAADLAIVLRSAALPAPIEWLAEKDISGERWLVGFKIAAGGSGLVLLASVLAMAAVVWRRLRAV